jgi:hypothetical protein
VLRLLGSSLPLCSSRFLTTALVEPPVIDALLQGGSIDRSIHLLSCAPFFLSALLLQANFDLSPVSSQSIPLSADGAAGD